MFEEKNKASLAGTQFLSLLKKLNVSTWVYLFTLALAGFLILSAFLQLQKISNLSKVNLCTQFSNNDTSEAPAIYIDLAGAVNQPGIYSLTYPQRLAQAIEKAGGLSKKADKTYVSQTLNLAKIIQDGEKVYVPFEGEMSKKNIISSDFESSNSALVSINHSSLEELDSLPGIGEKRANDIFSARPYSQLEDLINLNVLSEGIFRSIEEQIML